MIDPAESDPVMRISTELTKPTPRNSPYAPIRIRQQTLKLAGVTVYEARREPSHLGIV